MQIINLTPHTVRLNDGSEYPPSGTVARVAATYSDADANGVYTAEFGAITGLPDADEHKLLVVSGMVAAAAKNRADVVAPATGHPDCARRDGQVYSVPGWVR